MNLISIVKRDELQDEFGVAFVCVLYTAACLQHVDYISWKITEDPTLLSDEVKFGRLFSSIMRGVYDSGNLTALRFLISRLRDGLPLNPRLLGHWKNSVSPLTIWEWTIITAVTRLSDYEQADRRMFGELLEMFLKSGADQSLQLYYSDYDGREFSFMTSREFWTMTSEEWTDEIMLAITNKKMNTFLRKYGGATLHELVDFWQLENAAELKELLSPKPKRRLEKALDRKINPIDVMMRRRRKKQKQSQAKLKLQNFH